MKVFLKVFLGFFIFFLVVQNSRATLILDTSNDLDGYSPTAIGQNPFSAESLESYLGLPAGSVGELLFKQEGGTSGYYKDSYEAILGEDDGDPIYTTITWKGESYPIANHATYLVIKDGKNVAQYIWNLGSSGRSPFLYWDGKETIQIDPVLYDADNKLRDVSHVAIFGIVPEPATYIAALFLGIPFALNYWRGRSQKS